jgi:hypothetical protein
MPMDTQLGGQPGWDGKLSGLGEGYWTLDSVEGPRE